MNLDTSSATCRVVFSFLIVLGLPAVCTSLAEERDLFDEARAVDAACGRIEESAELVLPSGNFRDAADRFAELVACRLDSPVLEVQGTRGPVWAFLYQVESALYDRAVAGRAYALLRSGREAEAEDCLRRDNTTIGPLGERISKRRLYFSARVAELASGLFEQERWREAADAYALGRRQRLAALADEYDAEAARQQVNQALAEFNAGRVEVAVRLLEQLQSRQLGLFEEQIGGHLQTIRRARDAARDRE